MHDELAIVRRLLDSGADGYLLKRSACDELVCAVRKVAAGETYLDPALPLRPARPGPLRGSLPGLREEVLSEREAEVTQLLAHGLTMNRNRAAVEPEPAHTGDLSLPSHGEIAAQDPRGLDSVRDSTRLVEW